MYDDRRSVALLAQVARGLLRHGADRTARQLGDRTAYVGLSDVGRALTCMRAAVASKLGLSHVPSGDDIGRWLRDGENRQITDALGRQLILHRGHWLETGLDHALRANGVNLIPQLEIRDADSTVPILAHLDFVLASGGNRPTVRVLELKSTEHLPQILYPAYEAQIHGQIGLLNELWDRPAFRLKDESGTLVVDGQTFPQICGHLFGITMPNSVAAVDMEGWVLCLSMSAARAFGPYKPDAGMLALCRRTAGTLWSKVQAVKTARIGLDDVATCPGFHPLCDWCDHAEGCPKFSADPLDDSALDTDLAELARLKTGKADLDADIEVREGRIRQFCRRADRHAGWLSTANFRFKTTNVAGRKSIDPARLRAALVGQIGEAAADSLLARVTTQWNGFERLTVTALGSQPRNQPLP